MTDCYHILGIPSSATAAEIRSAYLAKMKALHPDAGSNLGEQHVTASDVTFAYWQLRDVGRRAEHDALLRSRGFKPPAKPPARNRKKLPAGKAQLSARAWRRRSARIQPLRTAAGALAFSVAAVGFVLAFTFLRPPGGGGAGGARAASLVVTAEPEFEVADRPRRKLNPALAESAADEFRLIVRSSGLEGAHVYGRQCLAELATQPSLSMLDYCIAFDNVAADWERAVAGQEADRRFFADQQRYARYRSLSQSVRDAPVREALMDEVSYFAGLGS